jgi:signal transduction histidine kinase
MLESMPLICNLWSREGRVFDCNEAALKLFDIPDKETYLERFLELAPAIQPDGTSTADIAVEMLDKVFTEGSCTFQYLAQKFDGTPIPQEVVLSRVLYEGEYIAVGYGRDLREQRKMEAEIERMARQQAEAESRAKSAFLAIMSHEIRTPINAIIGMTRIGKTTGDNERKDYALDKIEGASEHLLGIINDILDMSKIEANKLEISPTDFIFEKMLERVANVIEHRVEEKRQKLTIHVGDSVPKCLYGDDQRLAQVITNLLGNATKFTPESGSIHLEARLLEKNNDVCILQFTIKDTGIGIKTEHQAKLFDNFHQAESSTTRRYGGTGLGLSISKSIIEMMGGSIWVESNHGEGSTFTFTVKMMQSAVDASDIVRLQADDGKLSVEGWFKGRRILLVEDVEINQEVVKLLLEPTLVTIDCARNGAEAASMFSQSPAQYDLILMDVQMPEMDGYEATRYIRAFDAPSAKTVPIIAMTANVFREDVEKCLDAGMNDHVGKPLDVNEFYDTLRKYLIDPPPSTSGDR